MGLEVYKKVESMLTESNEIIGPLPTSATGGFVTTELTENDDALRILSEAITDLEFEADVIIYVNVDASTFANNDDGSKHFLIMSNNF